MQGRYQGVDWRDPRMWGCNGRENPFTYAKTDPVTLAPMELMFVKVKDNMLRLNYPSALAAVVYDMWQSHVAAVCPLQPEHVSPLCSDAGQRLFCNVHTLHCYLESWLWAVCVKQSKSGFTWPDPEEDIHVLI